MDRLIECTDRPPYFPFPSEPVSTANPVIDNLIAALQAAIASPLTEVLARRALADIHRIQGAARLGAISEFVTREFRLPSGALQSKTREQRITFCRQIAMYLCRKTTDAALEAIGAHFNRDHSTVNHAVNLVERRMLDPRFRRSIEKLEAQAQLDRAVPATAVAA